MYLHEGIEDLQNSLFDSILICNVLCLEILGPYKRTDVLQIGPGTINGNLKEAVDKLFNCGMTFFKKEDERAVTNRQFKPYMK